jgi:AcrR family transcriptional regulator
MSSEATRRQLLKATLQVIREQGFSGLSARSVAAAAGVNQALIFYHFGSMDGLVAETCRQATAERVALWSGELARVADLPALVELARRLHESEAEAGNVAVLAQALAASQANKELASVVGAALSLWLEPLEATARRILQGTLLEDLLSPGDVARTVAAAFVGVELFEGVVGRQERDAFEVLERVAALAALALESGPITKAALRRRLRTTARQAGRAAPTPRG